MRIWFTIAALLFSTVAPAADEVWAVAETESTRFPDSTTPGPTFAKDARLTVLVDEGDRLRVRAPNGYGWIARTAVTDVEPAATATPAGGAMPTFDLETLKGMIEKKD